MSPLQRRYAGGFGSDHKAAINVYELQEDPVPDRDTLIAKARAHGCRMPALAYDEAARARVPLAVACAFLQQESSGGTNEYGHDRDEDGRPRPFWGHGKVTEANYACYLVERDMFVGEPEGRRMQGVGPMQLTWWEFQDQADREGGCWRPRINMRVAFELLAGYRRETGSWRGAARKYNPGDPDYPGEVVAKIARWERALA